MVRDLALFESPPQAPPEVLIPPQAGFFCRLDSQEDRFLTQNHDTIVSLSIGLARRFFSAASNALHCSALQPFVAVSYAFSGARHALALGRKLSVCGLSLCRELGDLSVCSDESRPCRATAARSLAATRATSTRSDARCESRAAIIADSASAGGRVRGPSAATRAAAAASAHAAPEW